jgi:hypothetical protein
MHLMNEDDEIMILKMYVLHVHYMDEDNEIVILLHVYMFYMHISHKVLPHGTILFRSGSMWVAWQPHQKYGLSVGGPSPRKVPNPLALPCEDKMSI